LTLANLFWSQQSWFDFLMIWGSLASELTLQKFP
jgi:hypothetical protein